MSECTSKKICHECGSDMELKVINETFNYMGKKIEVENISAYVCVDCGEAIFSHEEVKRIEEILDDKLNRLT